MFSVKAVAIFFAIVVIICGLIDVNQAMPSLAHYGKRYETGSDAIPICLLNCAQCKNVYGDFFKGQSCGESCLKFNGKVSPDCGNGDIVSPFIFNALV